MYIYLFFILGLLSTISIPTLVVVWAIVVHDSESPSFSDVHHLLDPLFTGVVWHGVAWGVLGILSVYLVPK